VHRKNSVGSFRFFSSVRVAIVGLLPYLFGGRRLPRITLRTSGKLLRCTSQDMKEWDTKGAQDPGTLLLSSARGRRAG